MNKRRSEIQIRRLSSGDESKINDLNRKRWYCAAISRVHEGRLKIIWMFKSIIILLHAAHPDLPDRSTVIICVYSAHLVLFKTWRAFNEDSLYQKIELWIVDSTAPWNSHISIRITKPFFAAHFLCWTRYSVKNIQWIFGDYSEHSLFEPLNIVHWTTHRRSYWDN